MVRLDNIIQALSMKCPLNRCRFTDLCLRISERCLNVISFRDVYTSKDAAEILYELLAERTPEQNISHKRMPSFKEHLDFLARRPYQNWYLIDDADGVTVGSIYLTFEREIGLFLFQSAQRKGYGSIALAKMKELHPGPLFANISPRNKVSQLFFLNHGFELIQHTFRLG